MTDDDTGEIDILANEKEREQEKEKAKQERAEPEIPNIHKNAKRNKHERYR